MNLAASTRKAIAAVAMGAFSASLLSFAYLEFSYSRSRPTLPDAVSGAIHPQYYRGSCAYLTDIEVTGLSLLQIVMMTGFVSFFAAIPKRWPPFLPGISNWPTLSNEHYISGIHTLRTNGWVLLLGAFALTLAAIALVGRLVSAWLVERGITMNF